MILILLLCVKLSILHLCVSDPGYQCLKEPDDDSTKTVIYLIKGNNSDVASKHQEIINSVFQIYCEDYYEIHRSDLNQTFPSSDNVIHFAVPGYYDGKPLNDFVYAGNISKNVNAACTKTYNETEPEYDCKEFANLVSKPVLKLDDGHLYDFVQAIEYIDETIHLTTRESCEPLRKTSDLNVVLLCLCEQPLSQREVSIQSLKLIQHSYCCHKSYPDDFDLEFEPSVNGRKNVNYNIYKNRLLAVLAPKPYETTSDSLVPTIFYETPYMNSENKNDFPNSMNLVPWRLLKYGFLKFIQTVGWQRVAIVSDDSEYSVAFEDELSALFLKEKSIVHTVIRCEGGNCDMRKIAQELNRAPAWIVIANVEENNARELIRNTNRRITWLLRDIAGKIEVLGPKQIAFSFSLHINTKTKECDVEDNILTGLSGIAQAYENTKIYASAVKKRQFYRLFAEELQRVTPSITEAEIVIHRTSNSYSKKIARMSVNANGVTKVRLDENPLPSGKYGDGTTDCLVTTYDFYKPCENPLVLLLMFTIMLFVLTILLITCYFDKTSPFNDVRYQHF